MPAFTVTAVDTTANTLTATGIAAAGQPTGSVVLTGDRLRLRNVGGALPAATPALAGATDYFARRASDDAIQIYDTNAHALAGGSTGLVDLTGSGSGTTTIEFGLPYCNPTVIPAQGGQVTSFTVAAAWRALVALYALLTGQSETIWNGIVTLAGLLTANAGVTVGSNQHMTVSGTGKYKHGTKTIPVIVQPNSTTLPATGGVNLLGIESYYAIQGVPVGARLLRGRATVIDSATGPTKLALSFAFVDCSTPSSPTASTAGAGSLSAGNGTSQNITTAAVTLTTTSGQNWYLLITTATGGATCKVIAAEVDYDQP